MKGRLSVWLLHGLSWLPLGAQRRLATLVARVLWLSDSRMARTTMTNLELCLPDLSEKQRKTLAKQSLTESCKTIFEAGAAWFWPVARVLQNTVTDNEALFRAELDKGKGVILIAPHVGNWEVVGLWLAGHAGVPVTNLYQAPRSVHMHELIVKARTRAGTSLAPTDSKGVATLLKCLRRGEITGILPDQIPPENGGEFSPFFGRPALTMTLVSRLINKTGCRAVLIYASRIENGSQQGFRINFREVDERLYSQDLSESLAGLNATVEHSITGAPELYCWEYKRFRRQPEGVSRPY